MVTAAAVSLTARGGITIFESGGHTYAAVTGTRDDGVQILDVTNPSSITAAGSIGDRGSRELDGAREIATFESGGRTYAAVAAYRDDGVQILDVTNPSSITAAGSITDDDSLELDGAQGIAIFESGRPHLRWPLQDILMTASRSSTSTNPSSITAAGSITDGGSIELDGAASITIFESGGRTYAAVAAELDGSVQILGRPPTRLASPLQAASPTAAAWSFAVQHQLPRSSRAATPTLPLQQNLMTASRSWASPTRSASPPKAASPTAAA